MLPAMRGMEGEYLKSLDGILLSGGGDIDPSFFGEEPHPLTGWISPRRDAFELELARLALGSGMPVLGICRGLQVLNIAAGGDICQDISLLLRTPLKHAQDAPRRHSTHGLQLLPGSHLANLLGSLEIRVNSFHHQIVGRVAHGFSVTARSSDGAIEGLESQSGYALGVQFHPEEMWEREARFLNIFKALVEEAALGRIKKQS